MGDSTTSWTYSTTATIRQSNASTANTLAVFAGLAEEAFAINACQAIQPENNNDDVFIGIGVNSTTAYSGKRGYVAAGSAAGTGQICDAKAHHIINPALGIQNINFLESLVGDGNQVFYGGNDDMLMVAEWMG